MANSEKFVVELSFAVLDLPFLIHRFATIVSFAFIVNLSWTCVCSIHRKCVLDLSVEAWEAEDGSDMNCVSLLSKLEIGAILCFSSETVQDRRRMLLNRERW